MSDARKCRLFHRWQPVGNSDRLAPRATGRDGRAVRDRCDLQLLAEGWDRCVRSLRYEDGSPVEIVSDSNPYRKMLEGLDVREDK